MKSWQSWGKLSAGEHVAVDGRRLEWRLCRPSPKVELALLYRKAVDSKALKEGLFFVVFKKTKQNKTQDSAKVMEKRA